ncbi:MAG TPA: hypothetical protein DCF68_09715 [Cyanothece sp. UBA12306]|nr:hypothetical protein [Cyanothece sp. UBA12306]
MNQKQYRDPDKAIKNWQEKLAFLEDQKALKSNTEEKNQLKKQIDECHQEIRRLKWQSLDSSLKNKLMQVLDWKVMHENFQDLSLKLICVRGLISSDDYKIVLHDLENHWRDECSSKISLYTEFSIIIRSGKVRDEFEEKDRNSNWSKRLKDYAKKIDDIVDGCVFPKDLDPKMESLISYLSSLEKINGQVLEYLDTRLKVTISELENDFEELRSSLVPSLDT